MTALQKISQEAKRIYKANPNLSWKECIKKASLLYSKKKKNAIVKSVKSLPSKAKKVAVKKVKSGIKNLAKKVYDSKLLSGIKKPIAKKSPARSLHKDTKSHNVNIRVMSGVNKEYLADLNKWVKLLDNKTFLLNVANHNLKKAIKEKDTFYAGVRKREIALYKKQIATIKKHIASIKKYIK